MSGCGLLLVFIYSSVAVFIIVSGQSTTDDSQDDLSIVEQLAMLRAKVQMLEARQPSTLGNRCFSSNCLSCCQQ